MVKIIIAGGRDFNDYGIAVKCIDKIVIGRNVGIVSGKCRGADALGERYANEHNIPVKEYPADWDRYGKKAGYIRNKAMAEYADELIAFWDGQSKGTDMMITLARAHGLKIHVFNYFGHRLMV